VCLLLSIPDANAGDVVDFAASLIGRPYVWGAEGPSSFDCSGLTQYVYQEFGVDLPRRAISQSKIGDPAKRLQRGDLLFFSTDTRKKLVTHVGLYEGGGVMIDASKRHGRVRRDDVGEDYWVDRFMFARRVESSLLAGESRDRTDDPIGDRSDRSRGKRRTAVRVIERIAGELFKLPR
jgi:cell wall-associated NlpC family hydrolase